jgi:predicted RNA-binding Zn-ribbon protein involved in translation (DUF1610 family)
MQEPNNETDLFIPNEDAASEHTGTIQPRGLEACPQCGKLFKPGAALRMHIVRVHGKGWDTSANFKRKRNTSLTPREQKRIYQKKLRERYYREGRNSSGKLMPKGWKPKFRGGNAGLKLPPWTPERLAKFKRTMRKKAKERIQIVYPSPRAQQEKMKEDEKIRQAIASTWPEKETEVIVPTLKYCPNCGEHLEGWRHQS